MPRMHILIVLKEIVSPGEDLEIAFTAENPASISCISLLMLFTKMAVEIVFAAALHRAILFRTGELTGLLGNVTTGYD